MSHGWRALRRRILTPNDSATSLDVRGFHKKNPAAQELLETVGKMFLTGYGYAAEARTPAEAEENLEALTPRFRGFAYEGAGMGYSIRDGIPFGGKQHLTTFLRGRAEKHDYMVYIGLGWAMARLPRFCWPASSSITDEMLRWMVLDGYGFHQAYFKTDKYVQGQFHDPRFPWPAGGPSWYANRVIDQGMGRAMWFVGGTDARVVAALIHNFPAARQPDLFAGAGLAATYAGGADEAELQEFFDLAGPHRPMVAQGSAFAAEARLRAELLVPHTEVATKIFCGLTPDDAARVTHETRPTAPVSGNVPAYEVWRQRIASHFVSHGRYES